MGTSEKKILTEGTDQEVTQEETIRALDDAERAVEDAHAAIVAQSANVRALNVIIGLIAEKYPADYAARFVRECVELKQDTELEKKINSGMAYIEKVYGPKLYERLVRLFEQQQTESWEVSLDLPWETEETGEAAPAEEPVKKAAATKAPAKKTGAGKAPAKKAGTAAKTTTRKKTGRAADGK